MPHAYSAHRAGRGTGSPGSRVWMVLSHHVVLGIEAGSSARAACASSQRTSHLSSPRPPPYLKLYINGELLNPPQKILYTKLSNRFIPIVLLCFWDKKYSVFIVFLPLRNNINFKNSCQSLIVLVNDIGAKPDSLLLNLYFYLKMKDS